MKNLLCVLVFVFCTISSVNAQNVVRSNYGSKSVAAKQQVSNGNSTNSQSAQKYRDFTFGISDSGNTLGLTTAFSSKEDAGYGVVSICANTSKNSMVEVDLGYGLHYRSVGDDLMFVIYGYPSIGCYYIKEGSKFDFTYGLCGGAKIGYNVYTSDRGKKHFVTVGYGVVAPKLKTKDMIKNGAWQLGLTVEM